ncbi:MAG: hypothetical protein Q8Q29_10965, partial [Actinomycetota bacterium]|nr:hypothetical protein [Actinomycetota bacterium]
AHASAAAGAEADALAAQARIALKAAADRAVALGAHDQAVAFLEQALTVTADPSEKGEILERASESASAAARFESADEFAKRAVDLYRQLGNRPDIARATAKLGSARLWGSQTNAAVEVLEPAAAEFDDLWPKPEVVDLNGYLAAAYLFTDRVSDCLAVADRVLEIAEHQDLTEVLAQTLLTKGAALASLGRVREGTGAIRVGEDLAREAGLTTLQLRGILQRTYWELEADTVRALEGMREGLALARRVGDRRATLRLTNNVGFSEFIVGQWDEGLSTLEEPLREDVEWTTRAAITGNALVIRAFRGEPVTSELAELERLLGDTPDPNIVVNLLDAQGSQAFASGRLTEARSIWHRMISIDSGAGPAYYYQTARAALWDRDPEGARMDLASLDATGVHGRVIETRRATIRAGLAALEGHTAESVAGYREAIRAWHDLGLANDEAFSALDMAILLGPSVPEVGPPAASAREFFLRVGGRPFLERLDAAMGGAPVAEPAAEPAGEPRPIPVAKDVSATS